MKLMETAAFLSYLQFAFGDIAYCFLFTYFCYSNFSVGYIHVGFSLFLFSCLPFLHFILFIFYYYLFMYLFYFIFFTFETEQDKSRQQSQ